MHESGTIVNWWKYTDFKKPKFNVERVEKLMEGPTRRRRYDLFHSFLFINLTKLSTELSVKISYSRLGLKQV